jgi:hypothetical protein
MKKVILIQTQTNEVEKLLNDGWKFENVFQHPKGTLAVLVK